MDRARLPSAGTSRRLIAAVLAGFLLLAAAFAVGRLSVPHSGEPGNTSAEAGFLRDMQVHHEQAVQMSMLVRDRTDDEAVRLMAYDIALAQSQQAGQMYGWLVEWGLPQASPEPNMTWMTRPALDGSAHEHEGAASAHNPGDPMPGLATFDEIQQLKALSGEEAERLYLELMIEHHRGGVEMAEAVLARSNYDSVVRLAEGMVAVQDSEIEVMQQMLEALGR